MRNREPEYRQLGRGVSVERAVRGCLGKRRFDSRNAARDGATTQRKLHPEFLPLHPYRCSICGGFHLTTKPKRKGKAQGKDKAS